MALAPPVPGIPQGRKFGDAIPADFPYWHRGTEDAMFGSYSGATKAIDFHAGVDFAGPEGAPIIASEAGKVIRVGVEPPGSAFYGGGNVTRIRIAGGLFYVNCHQHDIRVVAGQAVARGQLIGHVGHTGNAFGSHDHYVNYTLTASGAILFRNPSHFLPGGKYANSALIKPAAVIVNTLVAVNGPGINLRGGPSTSWASVYISKPDGIYRTKDNVKIFSLATGFIFVKWVKNGIGEVWAQLKTGSGQVIYARSDLIHAIRGTLPSKP